MNAFRLSPAGVAAAILITVSATSALAASTPGADARQRYQQERAYCLSGQSQQDRPTCLREAGAAYAEARRGSLPTTGSTNYQANALARCAAQPAPDQEACRMRIQQGTTAGSVRDGGLIREIELPVQQ